MKNRYKDSFGYVVEAIQLTRDNVKDVLDLMYKGQIVIKAQNLDNQKVQKEVNEKGLRITSPIQEETRAFEGDYIVNHGHSLIEVLSEESFNKTYKKYESKD